MTVKVESGDLETIHRDLQRVVELLDQAELMVSLHDDMYFT